MIKNFEQVAENEVIKLENLDGQYFYEAKLPSVKRAQKAGMSDEIIERLFGIKLKPEDRRS